MYLYYSARCLCLLQVVAIVIPPFQGIALGMNTPRYAPQCHNNSSLEIPTMVFKTASQGYRTDFGHAQSYTLPFPKHAPPSTAIRQHQSPPRAPLPNLNDGLPHTPIATLLAADTIIAFPHKSDYLPTGCLHGKLGRLLVLCLLLVGSIAAIRARLREVIRGCDGDHRHG